MNYNNLEYYLRRGKIGRLPQYEGYFHWDYGKQYPYMKNGDYIKYDLDEEKQRTDWYYII